MDVLFNCHVFYFELFTNQTTSLAEDLKDGLLLINLLEKLAAPNKVGRFSKNPTNKVQMIENLGQALKFIKEQKIKLVNIGK